MKCECGNDTRTIDTRKIDQGVWRRRACPACTREFTTLEQRCETVASPYQRSRAAAVKAPPVPKVQRPNPPEKRAVALRQPKVMRDLEKDKIKAPWAPPPEPPKMRRAPRPVEAPPVDRVTPTARDRIEDMKFEREQRDYGWETK